MIEFKQFLEDADFEVSIELYPVTSIGMQHYQIFKPESSCKHCWEVYLNPNKPDDEIEIRTDYDTLDDAITGMVRDSEERAECFEQARNAYMAAMEIVCGQCCYESSDDCEKCNVRKTTDLFSLDK